jgi:hypothetical protein
VISVDPQSNDPRHHFEANPTVDELIAQQGKGPITDVQVLHGDFWPEDEPIEDFLRRSIDGVDMAKPTLPHEQSCS